jgi:hypothetical protein
MSVVERIFIGQLIKFLRGHTLFDMRAQEVHQLRIEATGCSQSFSLFFFQVERYGGILHSWQESTSEVKVETNLES